MCSIAGVAYIKHAGQAGHRGAHHALQDIFAEDLLPAKFEDHVVVLGEDKRAQELQAALWKVQVQYWIATIKACQSPL